VGFIDLLGRGILCPDAHLREKARVSSVHRPVQLRALGNLGSKPELFALLLGVSFVMSNRLGKEKRYVEVHKRRICAPTTVKVSPI
jgi:hypothetical protein